MLAWFISKPLAGPPLSVLNMMTVLSNIFFAFREAVILPTASSRADTIPTDKS